MSVMILSLPALIPTLAEGGSTVHATGPVGYRYSIGVLLRQSERED